MRLNRVEVVLYVILAVAFLAFICLTSYFYSTWITHDNEHHHEDDYLGFVRAFLIVLFWDASYKVFICVMLFRIVCQYYRGKNLLGIKNPSYDMSQHLIWQIMVAAIFACLTAFLDLCYLSAVYSNNTNAEDCDHFVLWLFTTLSLIGTDMLIMSILFALNSLIKHTYTKLQAE